jgi:competence protein ComEC
MTLPLLVFHFHRLSLISVLANLLVLTLQPLTMVLGGLAVLLGTVWLPLGQVLGWAVWLLLTYTIRVAVTLSTLPLASVIMGSVNAVWVVLYYLVVMVTLLWWRPGPKTTLAVDSPTRLPAPLKRLLTGMSVAATLVWIAVYSLPDGQLHVSFLDVGQGDAILIRTPGGKTVLLDGGPSPTALMAALGRSLPFWDRELDLLILSHPHDDHITGLIPVLATYSVGQVLEPCWKLDTPVYAEWESLIEERGIPRVCACVGTRVELDGGVGLRVLHPGARSIQGTESDVNNNSIVIQVHLGSVSVLLAGDIELEAEKQLLGTGQDLRCTVLKVPHHGSDVSLSAEFLAAVDPMIGVISVGRDNDFGHPSDATIARLREAAVSVMRTDEVGRIDIVTNGCSYSLRTTGPLDR